MQVHKNKTEQNSRPAFPPELFGTSSDPRITQERITDTQCRRKTHSSMHSLWYVHRNAEEEIDTKRSNAPHGICCCG